MMQTNGLPLSQAATFDLPSVIIEKRAKKFKHIVLLKLNTRILTTFEIVGAAGIALCTLLFTFVI